MNGKNEFSGLRADVDRKRVALESEGKLPSDAIGDRIRAIDDQLEDLLIPESVKERLREEKEVLSLEMTMARNTEYAEEKNKRK